MLEELAIRHFVTIDSLSLSFGPGLHVLTGESGAGKSLILDAIALLLGQRGSADWVRAGKDKASLSAQFSYLPGDPVATLLEEKGWALDGEEAGQLVVQRELYRTGKSLCRINGQPVTLGQLRELGMVLADMVRQHASMELFDPRKQRELLDGCLDEEGISALNQYRQLYRRYQKLHARWTQLTEQKQQMLHQQDLYRYQLQEIVAAQLELGEEERWEEKLRQGRHQEKILSALSTAYQLLDEQVTGPLGEALEKVEYLSQFTEGLKSALQLLKEAAVSTEEALWGIRQFKEQLTLEPVDLDAIEERLLLIRQLKRKYGSSIEEILSYARRIQGELRDLEGADEEVEDLEQELAKLKEQLREAASRLTRARQQAARQLSERVRQQLAELEMAEMDFLVLLQPHRQPLKEWGAEEVLFCLVPYPGGEPLPLHKISSGGELSRIFLALKVVLSDSGPATLLFDEVDTGVSGQSARSIAEKLVQLSRQRQVVCISHQPQVVSVADVHIQVSKALKGEQLYTEAKPLSTEERKVELARMLEGEQITPLSLKHAEEMLSKRQH